MGSGDRPGHKSWPWTLRSRGSEDRRAYDQEAPGKDTHNPQKTKTKNTTSMSAVHYWYHQNRLTKERSHIAFLTIYGSLYIGRLANRKYLYRWSLSHKGSLSPLGTPVFWWQPQGSTEPATQKTFATWIRMRSLRKMGFPTSYVRGTQILTGQATSSFTTSMGVRLCW